jgi:hypothetical protein
MLVDWLGTTTGGFVSNWGNSAAGVPLDWHVAGTGDFNGDGIADILWRNDNGQITDWLGQANGGFLPNDGNATQLWSSDWQVAAVGDFNADGRADILARSTDGTITDWLGQANGGFTDNSTVASQPLCTDLQVAGVGDFNADGFSDVLMRESDIVRIWAGSANGALLYGNGGVGQAIRNEGDPIFRIDVAQLFSYMTQPILGWDYALHYVLHELIHVTLAGDEMVQTGGVQGTTANPVESWTSRMAQALGKRTWGPAGPALYIPPSTTSPD